MFSAVSLGWHPTSRIIRFWRVIFLMPLDYYFQKGLWQLIFLLVWDEGLNPHPFPLNKNIWRLKLIWIHINITTEFWNASPTVVDRLGYYDMSRGNPHPSIEYYSPGIYYDPKCSSEDLNHGVLVVGYGFQGKESDNQKYWFVKNRYENPGIRTFEFEKGMFFGTSVWTQVPQPLSTLLKSQQCLPHLGGNTDIVI